jgi:Protein of unknown function (DUF3040)
MLERHERNTLGEIERQIAATDPGFAARLRAGGRRFPRTTYRLRVALVILLALLAVAFVVLGLPGIAAALVAVAAAVWRLRRWRVAIMEF